MLLFWLQFLKPVHHKTSRYTKVVRKNSVFVNAKLNPCSLPLLFSCFILRCSVAAAQENLLGLKKELKLLRHMSSLPSSWNHSPNAFKAFRNSRPIRSVNFKRRLGNQFQTTNTRTQRKTHAELQKSRNCVLSRQSLVRRFVCRWFLFFLFGESSARQN